MILTGENSGASREICTKAASSNTLLTEHTWAGEVSIPTPW
jgi:hypothetical protein